MGFINQLINQLSTDISTMSASYWTYKPTERYLGGTTLYVWLSADRKLRLPRLGWFISSSADHKD